MFCCRNHGCLACSRFIVGVDGQLQSGSKKYIEGKVASRKKIMYNWVVAGKEVSLRKDLFIGGHLGGIFEAVVVRLIKLAEALDVGREEIR